MLSLTPNNQTVITVSLLNCLSVAPSNISCLCPQQESHVWEQYVQQNWSFFPSATCFQIQEKQRALKNIEKGRQALELAVQDVSRSANKTRRHIPSSSNLHHSKTIATM